MKTFDAAAHARRLDEAGFPVSIVSATTPVGYLTMWPGFRVAAYTKPSWIHRAAMRAAFGWKWEDNGGAA